MMDLTLSTDPLCNWWTCTTNQRFTRIQ